MNCVYGDQNESCPVTGLSDRFHVLTAFGDEVNHGNTITTKCKFTDKFSWALCQNGQWTIQDKKCSEKLQGIDNSIEIPTQKPLIRKKRGWFRFRFRFRTRSFVGRIVCGIFGCPSPPPRDRTEPEIRSCPRDQRVNAIPIQRHAFVDWAPPTAWDNKDGQVSVHINGPYRPGGPFFEVRSPTTVGYYAKDSSGNMATCNFNIYVNVIRCPARSGTIQDGYRRCYPSSDMVLGTVCWYGCYQGHTLKGAPSRIECTYTGKWSNRDEPYCEKKECTTIVPRGQMSFSCTSEFFFRSICTFGCDDGFDIPKDMHRTKVCLASGYWNGADAECVDVERPSFEQCPNTLMFFPGDNMDTAYVFWNEPTVVDNKDRGIEPQQVEGPPPATKQEVNTYTVTYTARDLTGNEALDCTFNIVVKQLRCPRLYPLPYMRLNCTGTRRGSECSFSCDDNSVLVGSRTTYCKRNGNLPYSKWTMDSHPLCEISNGCPDLQAPDNGALACDVWVGGRFCHPLCSEGYSTYYDLPNMLVCQENGLWTKRERLSDCVDVTNSRYRYVIMEAEFYFSGNCTDPDTQMEIKEKYMTIIRNSDSFLVKKMCQSPQCNIGNVKVICGTTSKRSTYNMKINTEVYMDSGNTTLTSHQYEVEVFTVMEFLQALESDMSSDNISLIINNQNTYLLDMTFSDLNLDCPENSVPIFNKIVACVKCPAGTFYDQTSKTCTTCTRGFYQPNTAKSSCISCPDTQTTARVGAMYNSECEDACSPGSWSNTGLPPCVECDIGYYEDTYGSTGCSKCPGNKITVTESSTTISKCIDYDIVFPNSTTYAYTELQLTAVPLATPFVVTFHVICRGDCVGTLFHMSSSSLDSIELTTRELTINMDTSSVAENSDLSKKWFHIHLSVDQDNSTVFIDGQQKQTFVSNIEIKQGTTVDLNITLGGNGFVGTISQFNLVSKSTYDANRNLYASCNSEQIPSDLVDWNEFAYSSLINSYINVPSSCDDVDGCATEPCDQGNCTDKLGGYLCKCDVGFKGDNCDTNIDDCTAHACQNNASCQDEVNDYSCSCEYGFTGQMCEIAMVDGEWAEWDNWTECSVSCGNGTVQRRRACSDPLPDNGGLYCNGSDTEIEQCSLDPCRECSEILETDNSTLSCTNVTGMIVCTHTCNDGYSFDHDVKQEYKCGNETYYYWDFQTDDNPYGRLPFCTEIQDSTNIHVDHQAFYNMEGCDRENVSGMIIDRIEASVSQLTCVTSNICKLSSYETVNCGNSRRKRDTTESNVGFTFKLTCDTTIFGTDTCFHGLEDAIVEFETLESNDTLELPYDNIVYYILQNASSSDGSLDCPIGTIPFIAYCVPCSIGHYYSNEECISCLKGTYQDTIGQISCNSCPEGLSTEGTNSISIDDCNVPIPVYSTDSDVAIIIGVCVSIPLLVIITVTTIACCRQNRVCKTNKKEMKNKHNENDVRKIIFNQRTMEQKGDQSKSLSIIDLDSSPDYKTTNENSYCNEAYNDFDTILSGVKSPPPVSCSLYRNSPLKNVESSKMDTSGIKKDQSMTPRECWTPESYS